MQANQDKIIGWWLIFVAVWVGFVAVIGALTRLTDSGLSITEWNLIVGILPPLNQTEWLQAFALYKQIPQYTALHADMTLAGFKVIFLWEWGHRIVARLSGVVFALPLLFFWLKGWLDVHQKLSYTGLLLLGAMQGLVGWWMVQSGLSERVSVAPYRLMTHLGLATLLFVGLLACASRLFALPKTFDVERCAHNQRSAWVLLVLIYIQILLGALVAGNDAGLIYNTWPDMNGVWLPEGAYAEGVRAFFENHAAVQFHHRVLAYVLLIFSFWHYRRLKRSHDPDKVFGFILAVLVFCQMTLGIMTLITRVPIDLAVLHQLVAFLLIGMATWHTCRFKLR